MGTFYLKSKKKNISPCIVEVKINNEGEERECNEERETVIDHF